MKISPGQLMLAQFANVFTEQGITRGEHLKRGCEILVGYVTIEKPQDVDLVEEYRKTVDQLNKLVEETRG